VSESEREKHVSIHHQDEQADERESPSVEHEDEAPAEDDASGDA
jgi:hypothetical protein